MDVLREESVKAGVNNRVSNILKFHKTFLDQIKKKGRIDEVSLMIGYEMRSREFFSIPKIKELMNMAIGMLKKGKIKFPSFKKHSTGDIKSIYKKVFSH
jgi:hypothetical protein